MLELQDDGALGPAKEHPTAFRVELPHYSQQLRFLDAAGGGDTWGEVMWRARQTSW